MKTLLALLLLIPCLSWGKALGEFLCTSNVNETDTDIIFFYRYENYFIDDLGIKYSYLEGHDFYHLHIFETIYFEDMNWLMSISKKGGPIIFKYIDFTENITRCGSERLLNE